MSQAIYYSYKDALTKGLIVPGTTVISYPNHKGESLRGQVSDHAPVGLILVYYQDENILNPQYLHKSTGKFNNHFDTSYDINLIEIMQ